MVLTASVAAFGLPRREKDASQYGAGLIINIPFPEAEVSQVVQDIAQNGIIRGSKEYAKDEYVSGAEVASSSRAFPPWTEGGKVFYKVRLKALDPWNFKDSTDVGTLAVRYVVQAQDKTHTVLRIDAVFVEDFRRVSHASNGSVEGAEYKDIHDHLESVNLMRLETAEANAARQAAEKSPTPAPAPVRKDETAAAHLEPATQPPPTVQREPVVQAAPATEPAPAVPTPADAASTPPSDDTLPVQSLQDRVKDLRRQVERLVKAPGAPLRTAPFHSASTLQSLPGGTEVLIVISTTYWLGVETHEGQHGWILRDDLELLP